MIFLNAFVFLKLIITVSFSDLQEMYDVEMLYLLNIHIKYLQKDLVLKLTPKHIDVKLVTDNWIEVSNDVKLMDVSEITTIKIKEEGRDRYATNRFKIATSGADGLYSYFYICVPEFKQLLVQENTNKEELKNAVRYYMEKEKVPDILKNEIKRVMDNDMNNEEAKEYLMKANSELNAFMNINNVCKMNSIDPTDCEFYFFYTWKTSRW